MHLVLVDIVCIGYYMVMIYLRMYVQSKGDVCEGSRTFEEEDRKYVAGEMCHHDSHWKNMGFLLVIGSVTCILYLSRWSLLQNILAKSCMSSCMCRLFHIHMYLFRLLGNHH